MTHCVVASPFRLASPLGAPLSWPARQPRLLWSARRPSDNARTALDEPLLHGRSPGRASRTTATTTRAHCQSLGTLSRQWAFAAGTPSAHRRATRRTRGALSLLLRVSPHTLRLRRAAIMAVIAFVSTPAAPRASIGGVCNIDKETGASHTRGRLQRWPYPRRRRWRARGRLPPQPRTGARRRREQPRAGRVAGSRPPPAKRRQRRSGGPRTRPTW